MTEHNQSERRGKVYFIGAGPGAVDLITIRGRTIIDQAACIVYAGSLVNKELFTGCTVPVHDSSGLDLDQIIELIRPVCYGGGSVARVHTGDPSVYGAIREQMVRLEKLGIEYEVVPGVSSAFAAAATLAAELTLPEVSQTVILTRRAGRTPVPPGEELSDLARHMATMVIFLSAGMIEAVVSDLRVGGYPVDTPVAVVERASWPDETVVSGTLEDIASKVRQAGITKTALICVGAVFGDGALVAESKLYDKHFSHGTRRARTARP